MGLDNIPKNYPCKKQGTAVVTVRLTKSGEPLIDDGGEPITSIDCDATAAASGCPWKNDYEKSGLAPDGIVRGMMGTDCWYRGKYGNYLLEAVGMYDEPNASFYGDIEDATEKTPTSCVLTSMIIEEALIQNPDATMDGESIVNDLKYAAWWLRWVATEADGSICWY